MTFRIERDSDGRRTLIRLIGRLRSDHLDELKIQLEDVQSTIALDLEGVSLVDVEIVRFLNVCEDSGIELRHCCPYIREWMICEKDREK